MGLSVESYGVLPGIRDEDYDATIAQAIPETTIVFHQAGNYVQIYTPSLQEGTMNVLCLTLALFLFFFCLTLVGLDSGY